jgi:hypothetical protein
MTKRDNSTFAIAINNGAVLDPITRFYAPGATFDEMAAVAAQAEKLGGGAPVAAPLQVQIK